MNHLAITQQATPRRHLTALLITTLCGLSATSASPANAAGTAVVPATADTAATPRIYDTPAGRVMDVGIIEGIVVTPHGNYSQSEWAARQRQLTAARSARLAANAPALARVGLRPDRATDWTGVLATLPALPVTAVRAVTLSLPAPSAGL